MKLKRALSVFIDNFKTSYKLLLYKLIVLVVFSLLYTAIIYPVIFHLLDSSEFNALYDSAMAFVEQFLNGHMEELSQLSITVKENFEAFMILVGSMTGNIIWGVILLFVIFIVQNFFFDLGNFTTAAIINDKMTLQAKSPFIHTFIKNFNKACVFAAIYAPINVLFNTVVIILSYLLFFFALSFLPIIVQIVAFTATVIFAVSFKKTHIAGWLPAVISGKMKVFEGLKYALKMPGKNRWIVTSDFIVLNLVIMALVVASAVFTLGAGTILAVPAATIILYSYKFVFYFTENDAKYFTDETTIVKPKKEHKLTREEFFKGEQ
ncbi:MAG: hypothetical protein E7370_05890 [Clostridiales bacterium]|nr:hypothetical protein [Clostridiales bacterium]